MSTSDDIFEVNLSEILGATAPTTIQVLTLYIPNMDREEGPVKDHERWVNEAAALLARIGGGVTILPPCKGGWLNEELGKIIWEETTLVYTYVIPEKFEQLLRDLRQSLHRFGRETNQGEVAFEFDGSFYRIVEFDDYQDGG